MIPPSHSRRSFLKVSSALAGGVPILAATSLLKAQTGDAKGSLIAYNLSLASSSDLACV